MRKAFALAASAMIAGCTFLVQFDDPPSTGLELGTPDARPANDVSVPDTNVAPPDDAGPIEDSAAAVDAVPSAACCAFPPTPPAVTMLIAGGAAAGAAPVDT